ncbi:MAG TPA: peptide-methionine (S)-S-oxide reductase MsrA, partial [Gammaproteobacteria bacterium]
MPTPDSALPGRAVPVKVRERHYVNDHPLQPPFPGNLQQAIFGLGCFWGAERKFWQVDGVYTTAAGYSAGYTPNPSYQEVCTGMTGHNEVVLVVFDPAIISYQQLLKVFWEAHNPTQGMRQGNDAGTQYRSGIYYFSDEQRKLAEQSLDVYQARLKASGFPAITTEIKPASAFYYAEDYHQQYLAKNPQG